MKKQKNNYVTNFMEKTESISFKEDRKKEIDFLKSKSKTDNILVLGKKGIGKTSLIKNSVNNIVEIDLLKVGKNNVKKNNIFPFIDFVGKMTYICNNFWNIFIKFFLPSLLLYFTIAIPIIDMSNLNVMEYIILFSPIMVMVVFLFELFF